MTAGLLMRMKTNQTLTSIVPTGWCRENEPSNIRRVARGQTPKTMITSNRPPSSFESSMNVQKMVANQTSESCKSVKCSLSLLLETFAGPLHTDLPPVDLRSAVERSISVDLCAGIPWPSIAHPVCRGLPYTSRACIMCSTVASRATCVANGKGQKVTGSNSVPSKLHQMAKRSAKGPRDRLRHNPERACHMPAD